MSKIKVIGTVLTVILTFGLLPAREPVRVGIDVPEPELVRKSDIIYPDPANRAQVVLDILIDEKGEVAIDENGQVADVVLPFVKAAKSAVKQWRFSPTLVNGQAVPVAATLAAVFPSGFTPRPVDLGIKGGALWLPNISGNMADILRYSCFTPAVLDRHGNLQKGEPPDVVMRDLNVDGTSRASHPCIELNKKYQDYLLIPDSDVPFSVIEEKMKGQTPLSSIILRAPQYRFASWRESIRHVRPGVQRLYYSALVVSDNSQLVQLSGIDPDVVPPRFDLDLTRLAQSLDASLYPNGAVFFYTVFVDESGGILGIETSGDGNSAITDALSKSRVITPGLRKGAPVPTAVLLAIKTPSNLERAAKLLDSTDVRERAWGAYFVGQSRLSVLQPKMQSVLRDAAVSDESLLRSVIDAEIRVWADLPTEILTSIYRRYPDETTILLAQHPQNHVDLILSLFRDQRVSARWLALGNLLLETKAPGFPLVLMQELEKIHIIVSVHDPDDAGGGTGGGWGEGAGEFRLPIGYPPVTVYSLVDHLTPELIAKGPRAIYAKKTVINPGESAEIHNGGGFIRDYWESNAYRLEFLSSWFDLPKDDIRFNKYFRIDWKGPVRFAEDVTLLCSRILDKYDRILALLMDSNLISRSEAETLESRIFLKFTDFRRDKGIGLPEINLNRVVVEK